MKFRINWIECHNPLNWCDTNIKGWLSQMKNGIKNIMASLPEKSTHSFDGFGGRGQGDEWIECDCIDTFEAKTIKQLRKKVEGYDIPEGIFSVLDIKGHILFIEEDIDKLELLEYCPKCWEELTHFTLNNEDIFGCKKCNKEVEGKNSIKLRGLIKQGGNNEMS